MNDVEERARHLIDAARAGHGPDAAAAARVRAALKARVLAEPLLIQPSVAPAASGVLGKVLVALGVGSSLGFAAGLYAAQAFWPGPLGRPLEAGTVADRDVASRTQGVTAPLVEGSADTEASASAEATAAKLDSLSNHDATQKTDIAAPAPRRARSEAGSSAAPVSPVSPLQAELDGLRRAQELLYQGRPAWAIARLDELDRARVGSVLLEERAATRAIAQCRLGGDGQRQADEYARRFPRSAHLERVRSSCAEAPRAGTPVPSGGTPARKVAPEQTESRGSSHEQ